MAQEDGAALIDELPIQSAPQRASVALPRLRTAERRQVALRAVDRETLLADDHRVRLVWSFVEGLDLAALYSTIKAVEGRPGHPPADPRILLGLDATVQGIGSARELARLCEEHIAFQCLCGGVGMNAKTLADFRVAHGAVLKQLLADGFAALLMIGAAKLDRVAQDGVRVRAAAGAASFRRHSTLEVCRQEADERECRLRAELEHDPGAASRRQAQRASGRRTTARGPPSRRWRSPKRCGRSNKSVRISVPSGRPGSLPLPSLTRRSRRNPSRR